MHNIGELLPSKSWQKKFLLLFDKYISTSASYQLNIKSSSRLSMQQMAMKLSPSPPTLPQTIPNRLRKMSFKKSSEITKKKQSVNLQLSTRISPTSPSSSQSPGSPANSGESRGNENETITYRFASIHIIGVFGKS